MKLFIDFLFGKLILQEGSKTIYRLMTRENEVLRKLIIY